jgi:hypothetical protein
LYSTPKFIVRQSFGPSSSYSRKNCGTKKRNKQEVVEVAGLKGRVLAVVREAEDFAPFWRKTFAIFVHPPQGA